MTEKDFSISVIMPVYKVSGYIGRSIESLVAQTYKNFEIILVDDCGETIVLKKPQRYLSSIKTMKVTEMLLMVQ